MLAAVDTMVRAARRLRLARRVARLTCAALMLGLAAGCAQVPKPSLPDMPDMSDLLSVSPDTAPEIKYCEGDYDGLVHRTEQTNTPGGVLGVGLPAPVLISDGSGDGATGVALTSGEKESALRLISEQKTPLVASDVKKLLGAAFVFKKDIETSAHSETVAYGRLSHVDEKDIMACAQAAQVEKIEDNDKRQVWSVTGFCANQTLELQTLKNKQFVAIYEKVRHNCGPALLHKVDSLVETEAK